MKLKTPETVLMNGPKNHETTMVFDKQSGAVVLPDSPPQKGALSGSFASKALQKAGALGGVAAAALATTQGASAAEVAAIAIPGGQSALSASKGNYFEAILQGMEETGIGTIPAELTRLVARAFGADIEKGIVQEGIEGVSDYLNDAKNWSNSGIRSEQQRMLVEAGFPEMHGKTPINEAIQIPEVRKGYENMMIKMDNLDGMNAIAGSLALQKILDERTQKLAGMSTSNEMGFTGPAMSM